jgi:hypothetical protein
MKNRLLRTLLVVLALAAQAAAGSFVVRAESRKAADRARFAALLQAAGRAQALLGDLRSAEAALLAPGQDAGESSSRVAGVIQRTRDALAAIDRASLATEAAQDVAAATGAVSASAAIVDRARELVGADQPLAAASLVFGDAARRLGTASGALASACLGQHRAVDLAASAATANEAVALGGAAAWTSIVLLILLPRTGAKGMRPGAEQTAPAGLTLDLAPEPGPEASGRGAFDLALAAPSRQADSPPAPEPPHPSERQVEEEARRASDVRLNPDAQVDLAETARLCADLARMNDAAELSGLLARAAQLLDASGIVVWMAGPGGTDLRPAASVGYHDHAVARMQRLLDRSDNAVSAAFRAGRLQVVPGGHDRPGAVVAPIVTAGGCAGVMAAEVRHGVESSPSVQAAAAILAAQLASLVAETAAP